MSDLNDVLLQIEVLEGAEAGEVFEFDDPKVKVGKLASSQLNLDDAKVSRIHAVFERKPGGVIQLIDLGSASGTYLNGQKVSKQQVSDGDEVRFGDTTVRVSLVDPAQAAASRAAAEAQAVPEGHIQLEDGTVVEPFTMEGYYDDDGNYIPGYYDEEGTYHYGYGYYDDEGTWQVAEGYYDPDGEWIPTGDNGRSGPSDTELYTENFFHGQTGQILEVAHLWSDQVLDVQSLKKPRSIVIGADEENDYVLENSVINHQRFPLIVHQEGGGYSLNFLPSMKGMIKRGGEQMSLEDAISSGMANTSVHVQGGYQINLSRDTSVRLDVENNTFLVHFAPLPALAGGAFGLERAPFMYQGISLAAHIAFMILVFTLPATYGQLNLHDHDAQDRFAELAAPPEEEEEEPDEDWLDDDEAEDASEAEAADEDEVEDVEEIEVEGDEMDEEEMQVARDREIARGAGALAAFEGEPQEALGGAAETALADLDADHSASGVGGLGLAGAGRGGAEGGEGLGRANVGAGSGTGAGGAPDADLGDRDTLNPEVIPEEPETTGALDREIIQRVVRQNRRQIQHCYEQRLQRNPDLAGRITMQWTISPTGDVVSASVQNSTVNDTEVEQCMRRRIMQWVFPEPDGGGVVRVNYPWNFSA